MSFISVHYLLFLPCIVFLYFLLPFRFRWVLLLAGSCYFYMALKPEYIFIIIGLTLLDYIIGRRIKIETDAVRKRNTLILGIVINVSVLFFFKYFNFFNETTRAILQSFNIFHPVPAVNILLPIGISFHTFQSLSYLIDIYRGLIEPEKHIGKLALYLAFFPQLVAGPIERAKDLLPQFSVRHYFDYEMATDGLKRIALGLFKKVVIADRLAAVIGPVYADPSSYGGLTLVIATFLFSYQIYCDFSGYTDIAIGSAELMGYRLSVNFRRPYAAVSIADFWRRWHITLSSWFRDYLYIPLGGNRVLKWRMYYNLMIVFLVSGLWHGAAWTFVIWGGLNGFYLILSDLTSPLRKYLIEWSGLHFYPRLHHLIQVVTTFLLVSFGWVFFRASSINDVWTIFHRVAMDFLSFLQGMIHPTSLKFGEVIPYAQYSFLIGVVAILILEIIQHIDRNGLLLQRLKLRPPLFRWSYYSFLAMSILFFGRIVEDSGQFIYFQF